MKKNIIWTIVAIIVAAGAWYFLVNYGSPKQMSTVNTFEECAAAGYPIMESYPRQCKTPDGRTFTEVIEKPSDHSDLIIVDSPKENDSVSSPLVVKGKARGNWYFEASFPIQLTKLDGTVLVQAPAQAQGDWMTTEFVPFEVTLKFTKDQIPNIQCIRAPCNNAVLVLKKDNPSGLPENEDSISIPITLSPVATGGEVLSSCRPTGCSGEVCSDEPVVSTCVYRAEYACYKNANCARQSNGKCGWTQTAALLQCLKSPPPIQ